MEVFVSVSLSWGIIFLMQTSAGILGNSLLFCLYVISCPTAQALRPMDLILQQLVIANNFVIFSKGIPHTMATLGLRAFLDDAGCKLVFYLHRVARGVCLSTTSLLSGFQAIKLCPNISGWIELKSRSLTYVGVCCFLCWILHLLLNIPVIMNVTGPNNSKNMSIAAIYRYCYSPIPEGSLFFLIGVMHFFADAMCLGLMAWTSGSMVLVLKRHKQRVQHIHSHSLSPRPSHEDRATCTILILVSMFVSFYSLSAILSACITQTVNPSPWLMTTSVLVSSGFPTFSPFVFIFRDTWVSQFCFVSWTRRTNSPVTDPGL